MNNVTPMKMLTRTLLYLALLITLVGCDGGLFGTGDGGDIVIPPESSAPQVDADTGDINNPVEGGPTNPPLQPNAPDSSTSMVPEQVFQNSQQTGDNSKPLVTVVNVSTQPVNIISEGSANSLFNSDVLPGLSSEHAELAENTSSLLVINSDTEQPLARLSSLELAPSTVSTLIAYDAPTTTNDPDQHSGLNVIALATQTSSIDPGVASVRLVQANQLGANDTPATMTLSPAGSNPGSGEVLFNDVTLAGAANSEYMSVNAGSYQLQDSLMRFDPVPLSVEAGSVYTVIIKDTIIPVLIIELDSIVDIQTNAN